MRAIRHRNPISKTKQIQQRLKNDIDQIAPDIFPNILEKVRDEKEESSMEWYERYRSRKNAVRRTKRRALTAIAACLFMTVMGIWQYDVNFSVAATVMLDVNPSIQMDVSKSGRILSIQSNNEDGESIVSIIKKEKTLNKALMMAIEELEQEHYFDQEESAMLISYLPKKNMNKINEIMESTVEEYQKTHENSPKAIIMKVTVDSQVENLSKKESVSVGKSAFCIKTAAKVPKTAEELSTQNITEIAKTYYDENYPSQDEDIRLKQREKESQSAQQESENDVTKDSQTSENKTQTDETQDAQGTQDEESSTTKQIEEKETQKGQKETEQSTSEDTSKQVSKKENETNTKASETTKAESSSESESKSSALQPDATIKETTSQTSQTALKIKKVVCKKNHKLVIKFNKKTVWDAKITLIVYDKDMNPLEYKLLSQTEKVWTIQVKGMVEGENYQLVIEGIKGQNAKTYKTLKKKFLFQTAVNEEKSDSVVDTETTTIVESGKEKGKEVVTKNPNRTSSQYVDRNELPNSQDISEEKDENGMDMEETTTGQDNIE